MIIKRLAEGIKNQDWFVVMVEVMIVVVGIFIGLQVDDWNEQRKEKSLSRMYQQNLLSDLRNDVVRIKSRIDYLSTELTLGEQALSLLTNKNTLPQDPIGAIISFYAPSNKWAYYSNQATFDELRSSGRLDLIGDKTVRDNIVTLYARRKNAKELGDYSLSYRNHIRGIIPIGIGTQISNSCESFPENDNGVTTGRMKLDCTIDVDEKQAATIVQKIIDHPDTEHTLTLQMSNLVTHQKSLRNLLGATKKRISQLEQLIKDEPR